MPRLYSQYLSASERRTRLASRVQNNDSLSEIIPAISARPLHYSASTRIVRGPRAWVSLHACPIGLDERAITSCHVVPPNKEKNSREIYSRYGARCVENQVTPNRMRYHSCVKQRIGRR